MKSSNKLVAMLLSLIMAAVALTSCYQPTGPLQSDTYVANVDISFSSEDAEMQSVINSMGRNSKVYVSGDDMKIETSVTMTDLSVIDNYVLFSGTLFHESRISVAGKSVVELKKTSMSEENRKQLIESVGAGASIDPIDFNIQEQDEDGGKTIYNCSRMTSKAKESIEKIYGAKFSAIGATLTLTDAEYYLVTANERNEKSMLTCHFVVEMNGQTYNITMEIATAYDYDTEFGITTPANSSNYQQVSYDEIIK